MSSEYPEDFTASLTLSHRFGSFRLERKTRQDRCGIEESIDARTALAMADSIGPRGRERPSDAPRRDGREAPRRRARARPTGARGMTGMDSPFWTDPLHDEREEARAIAYDGDRFDDDRPTRAEIENDEHPTPYRIEDDCYRGTCGGCGQPVSAFVGHPGGHEGSCLWKGGPWHPSCREADPERPAILRRMAGLPV
jgi:hypothetical protein